MSNVVDQIAKDFKGKTIISVFDYREKGIYVVKAVPTDRVNEADEWLDCLFKVDNKTLKQIDAFQPMDNDPKTYFSLPSSRMIYERGRDEKPKIKLNG